MKLFFYFLLLRTASDNQLEWWPLEHVESLIHAIATSDKSSSKILTIFIHTKIGVGVTTLVSERKWVHNGAGGRVLLA